MDSADVPISGAPTQTKRQEFETPYKEFCWTRFENKFWSTSSILTGSSRVPWMPLRHTPLLVLLLRQPPFWVLRPDLLNVGILDLRNNGLTWNGPKFTCSLYEPERKVAGDLLFGDNNVPKGLNYEISDVSGKHFRYVVTYAFGEAPGLPDFFSHLVW